MEVEMSLPLTIAGWTALAGLSVVQRQQLHAARHDPLTGLATRRLWTRRAERALRRPGLVIVLIDGDRVKAANDTWGHDVGDAVITALASRLRSWTGVHGSAGRLGGDEFVAYVRLASDRIDDRLEELCQALAAPVPIGRTHVPGGASIGAVRVDDLPERTLRAALSAADRAMYHVKATRGGAWHLAEAEISYERCEPASMQLAGDLQS